MGTSSPRAIGGIAITLRNVLGALGGIGGRANNGGPMCVLSFFLGLAVIPLFLVGYCLWAYSQLPKSKVWPK